MDRRKRSILMSISFLIFAAILIMIFRNSGYTGLEREIRAKIKRDAPQLAQIEAVYGIVFTNQEINWVMPDDIYIRKDQASVYYGYDLEKARIEVIERGEEKILKVLLPEPHQISVDRKVISIESTREGYKPLDENGDPINVDHSLNENLEETVSLYERKSLQLTREITQQYFKSLAGRFNLQLDLSFYEGEPADIRQPEDEEL